MKTTKAELLQKIIEKQDELIKYLNDGYETEMIEEWEKFRVRKCENELTALNAQLKQSTTKSTIERKDFFEPQMEEEDDYVKLRNEPQRELYDIIDCIKNFDDSETLEKKGRFFDIIQRDLRELKPQPDREMQMKDEPQLDEIIKQLSGEPIPDIHTITSTGFVEPEEFYRKPERPDRETLREELIKFLEDEQVELTYGVIDNDEIVNKYLTQKDKT